MRRCSLVLTLMLASAAARADEGPKPLGESLEGPAREAYDSGKFLFTEDPAKALTKFKRAYEISHDARLLYNMAVCEKALKHYARLQTLLLRYLEEGGTLISAESRATATETLRAVKPFVENVTITSAEAGATVSVDQEEVGATPLSHPIAVDIGPHAIEVRKPGFLPFVRKVEVTGGEDASFDAVLVAEASAGRLVIEADAGASISIDDEVVGTSRWNGTRAAGPHTVRVTAAGRKPYEAHVDLAAGTTRTVNVSLAKEGLPLWAIIGGGVVLAAGLTVGGYFLFKPDDKPGQQVNGTVATLQTHGWHGWRFP